MGVDVVWMLGVKRKIRHTVEHLYHAPLRTSPRGYDAAVQAKANQTAILLQNKIPRMIAHERRWKMYKDD